MKKRGFSRREFLQVGAGATAGLMAASFIGCSGGGGGGSGSIVTVNSDWSYQGQRAITAVYRPTDSALYRQLLPDAFEMPDSLQVIVTVVNYYNVSYPLVPYNEGYVLLSCKYRGVEGVYTLTMPIDDKLANDAGRSIGFNKYMADTIRLSENGGAWNGEVIHQGRSVMRMTFNPRGGSTSRNNSDPGSPAFNLTPPGVGPQVLEVNSSLSGSQTITTTPGTAVVTADPGETWGPLLQGATLVSAQFEDKTGNWTLVPGNEPKTAIVSIARIRNNRIDLAVEEAIALLGGIGAVTTGKQRIMLKPNLVSDSMRSTTKPDVVRTLARLMQEAGKEVSIGEGSAACNNFNVLNGVFYRTKNPDILNGMQQHIFDTLGYSELAQSMGIPLINLHTGEMATVAVPDALVYNNLTIHRSLTEIDLLCSVPMMKTHMMGGVTLGMKNLIGTYPGIEYGSVRSLVHDQGANVEGSAVAGIVMDIMRANKTGLVVIDGSMAMEGNGPENGTLVKMDLIIAGTNPLATDMVAASIMGFYPVEIPTFLWANDAGMQPQRMNQIEIRGESIASVQRKFVRPQIAPWSTVRNTFGAEEI
jgi:uncharacterized protein (DUF362 family)